MRQYRTHAKPTILRQAVATAECDRRDRGALGAMDDVEAVSKPSGATVLLREAVLDVLVVPAGSFIVHKAKCDAVNAVFDQLSPAVAAGSGCGTCRAAGVGADRHHPRAGGMLARDHAENPHRDADRGRLNQASHQQTSARKPPVGGASRWAASGRRRGGVGHCEPPNWSH